MANTRVASNFGSAASSGKPSSLPPKSPFPSMPPSYREYHSAGSKGILKQREGNKHHQRTSSESFLIEEQPSWLDELLDEPETPARRGAHRRSSSDSFAYFDPANAFSNLDSVANEECSQRSVGSLTSWGSQEFDHLKDVQHAPYYTEASSFGGPQNRGWESAFNTITNPFSLPSAKEKSMHPRSSCGAREPDALAATVMEKRDQEVYTQDPNGTLETREGFHAKHAQSETDSKRVKQQFAQRSRVRKLQYIAELETHVQALQAEGLEVSAELEFLDKQNLILNLENKALKQRLDSLAQEQLIKHIQHEMLEREIGRLKSLHQQQPAPTHGRRSSRDLDSQFAGLSLKHKEAGSAHDTAAGPLHI